MKYTIALLFIAATFGIHAQNTVLSEDFENGIPSDWKIVNRDNLTVDTTVYEYTNAWITTEDPYDDTTDNQCASATSFFTTIGNAERWLITPAITLADHGNLLTYRAASFDPSFPDNYAIKIGTDADDLASFETLVTVLAEAPYWSTHKFEFDTLGYNNQTIYLAFVLISDNGHKLYLDDIQFETEVNLATAEASLPNIEIYPNPTSNILHVINGNDLNKSIYTIQGELLLDTTTNQIDVSTFPAGIYFLQLENHPTPVQFIKE